MITIEQLKSQIQELYWTNNIPLGEIEHRKNIIQEIINNKNKADQYKNFESLILDLQGLIKLNIRNTSVTYFPSYSFQITLQIENYENYTIVSEFQFYISVVSKTFTGYFVKYIIDTYKFNSKEKKIMFNPLILTTPPDRFIDSYNLVKKTIANSYHTYQYFSLSEYLVPVPVENISYTVNDILLFHLVFADFTKNNFKIV